MKTLKYSLIAASLVFVAPACAQSQDMFGEKPALQGAVEEKMIELYGQELDPDSVVVEGTDYTWSDLDVYVDSLLPEARTTEKSPAELCDHLGRLEGLYLNMYEDAIAAVAPKFEGIFHSEVPGAEVDVELEIAQRVMIKGGSDELVRLMPDLEGQIMMVQDAHNKYLTVSVLSQAAQHHCPAEEVAPSVQEKVNPPADLPKP